MNGTICVNTNIALQSMLDIYIAKKKRIDKQKSILYHAMNIARQQGDLIEAEMISVDIDELDQKLKEFI